MIRVGVIGTGIMGADHARLLSSVIAGAVLGAAYDIDRGRAEAVAALSPSARTFDDPHVLIKDPDVDAVLIASSDATHEEFVLSAVAAGKPVICEKPLAPTAAACQRILAAEQAAGRRLVSVGFMRRHDPGYMAIKASLMTGVLGQALVLHNVHRNPSAPAGLAREMVITGSAVHELDVVRWLLDTEITAVTVHQPHVASAGPTGPLLLLLETASGAIADVEVFVNAGYGYDVRCELVGAAGTVTLDAPAPIQRRLAGFVGHAIAADWRPRFAEAYRRELQDWVDAIAGGRPGGSASAWDGYVATIVAQAGVLALATGGREPVTVPDRPALYR